MKNNYGILLLFLLALGCQKSKQNDTETKNNNELINKDTIEIKLNSLKEEITDSVTYLKLKNLKNEYDDLISKNCNINIIKIENKKFNRYNFYYKNSLIKGIDSTHFDERESVNMYYFKSENSKLFYLLSSYKYTAEECANAPIEAINSFYFNDSLKVVYDSELNKSPDKNRENITCFLDTLLSVQIPINVEEFNKMLH